MRWLALALLTSCASYQGTQDPDTADPLSELDSVLLRVDVHPPVESQAELLAQTFEVDLTDSGEHSEQGVRLVLSRPATVEGRVTGYLVSPWLDPDLPGEIVPVEGEIVFRQPSSAQVVHTTTNRTGRYTAQVVPGFDYRLSVVPDTTALPLQTQPVSIEGDLTLNVRLGDGYALWGVVLDEDGEPMEGARVAAVNYAGVSSSTAHTDAEGRYLIRVVEGSYAVVCRGRDNGRDPTLSTPDQVVGLDGTRVDFTFSQLDTATVSGRLLAHDGLPVSQATVRFEAVDLDGYEDQSVSFAQEALPNSSGTWDLRVLPGIYRVEVRPDADEASTPLSLGLVDISRDQDLGPIQLPPHQLVVGTVVDPSGEPVPGAVLRVAEVGFGHRDWSFASDLLGDFEASLPQVELEYTLSPPGDRAGQLSTTRLIAEPTDGSELLLPFRQGSRVRGMVLDPVERPLTYAVVEVRDDAGDLWALTLTNDEGRFDIGIAWTP